MRKDIFVPRLLFDGSMANAFLNPIKLVENRISSGRPARQPGAAGSSTDYGIASGGDLASSREMRAHGKI